jgi:DNA-binding NarL/FixJ family response regulator
MHVVAQEQPSLDNPLPLDLANDTAFVQEGYGISYDPQLRSRFTDESLPKEARLTNRELEVARLVLTGSTYEEIAASFDPPLGVTTVRTHIHHIYGKLGITKSDSSEEGRALLPFAFKPEKKFLRGIDPSKLTPGQREVFDGLVKGLTTKEIALQAPVPKNLSTIRSRKSKLYKIMGVRDCVELGMVANAWRERTAEVASVVQEVVKQSLDRVQRVHQKRTAQDLTPHTKFKFDNPKLMLSLFQHDYISHAMQIRGAVDLRGLIAGMLLINIETGGMMTDSSTADIAQEVIWQEVRIFQQEKA